MSEPNKPASVKVAASTGPASTVLVVDDDPDIVSLLSKTLGSKYRVLHAGSGTEALTIVAQNELQALITDQKMPGMTGVQLARAVHAEDPLLSIVLLTAYTDPADVIAAINEGEVFRYVTKPWDVSDLLVTTKTAVERTRLNRENARLVAMLDRQLAAITLVGAVGRDVGITGTSVDVFAHLLRRLPGILNFDLAAAIVADQDDPSRQLMHIHCAAGATEAALLHARDRALELCSQVSGRPVAPGDVVVRVAGSDEPETLRAPENGETWSEISVPVTTQSQHSGVLVLWSTRPNGYSQEDIRLLDVLASEAEVILRQQQDVVRKERHYFSVLMSALVDGVVVARLDGAITLINAAARGFLGLMPDALLDSEQVWRDLKFSPRQALEQFEDHGPAPVRFECEILGRPLEGIVAPVFDSQRRLDEVAFTLRDHSEERELERKKDAVIATVSHELRTPLSSISASLELATDQFGADVPQEMVRYLDAARDSSKRLHLLLDDILDLSRQQSGQLGVTIREIDLAPVVDRLCEEQRAAAEQRGVKIIAARADSLMCAADEARITQVLTNLMSNALKFATPGSEIRITAGEAATQPAFVVISVWNEGPEIPRAEQDRIFLRFEQGSTAELVKQVGSGLGLSIAASLVQAHGGFLQVQSGGGKGTLFSLALPTKAGQQLLPTAEAMSSFRGMRVLIIDDEPMVGMLLYGFLTRLGLEPVVVSNGSEALSVARSGLFDAILTDVRMPDVDGLMLSQTLRHDPATRRVPIIVFSVVEQAEAARRAGAWAFLPKPLDLAALTEKLRGVFEQRSQGEQPTVLVVDDDEQLCNVVEHVLSNLGHRVFKAHNWADASRLLADRDIDIMLLDVGLPDGDAVEHFRTWRERNNSSDTITLVLSGHGETIDKVRALKAGVDDYLVKPLEPLELAARIDSAFRRREREMAASPTTRLPGSLAIEREVTMRVQQSEPFTLCYLDLDNLKAFNDVYGYAKTDAVIKQTGDIMREVVGRFGGARDFIGHVAGDDFVCIFSPENAETLCRQIIKSFDKIVPLYYDPDDRRRGYIETEDRYGQERRFPIMTLSVAAIAVSPGARASYASLSLQAAEIKKMAKALPGSAFLVSIDGRPPETRTLS